MRSLAILCVCSLSIGCGTSANLCGQRYSLMGPTVTDPRPFGGVGNDIRWTGEQLKRAKADSDVSGLAIAGYFALVDLPLSIVGDTLTLPQAIRGIPSRPKEPKVVRAVSAD